MEWYNIVAGIFGAFGVAELLRLALTHFFNRKKDVVENKAETFKMLSTINDKLTGVIAEQTNNLIESQKKTAEILHCKLTLITENAELKTQIELLMRENKRLKSQLNEMQNDIDVLRQQIKDLRK